MDTKRIYRIMAHALREEARSGDHFVKYTPWKLGFCEYPELPLGPCLSAAIRARPDRLTGISNRPRTVQERRIDVAASRNARIRGWSPMLLP